MLSSHLCLRLRSVLFPSGLKTTIESVICETTRIQFFLRIKLFVTMIITAGKCTVFSRVASVQAFIALFHLILCLPSKQHKSWTHVVLIIGFDLGFDHKDISDTHSDLKHNHVSHAYFLPYFMAILEKNMSSKIYLACDSRCRNISDLWRYQKLGFLSIIWG